MLVVIIVTVVVTVVVVIAGGVPSIIKLSFVIIVDLTGDEDTTDEDGDIGMGDSTGVSVSLGGGISSGGKNFRNQTLVVVITLEIEARQLGVE
ncbi:hypothetical protein Tco_0472136 [Tanacetum coccineum]